MIYTSDHLSPKKPAKRMRTLRGALKRRYQSVCTDLAGTPEEHLLDRIYTAWREDEHGEVEQRCYMRIWWKDSKLDYLILPSLPKGWQVQLEAQATRQ